MNPRILEAVLAPASLLMGLVLMAQLPAEEQGDVPKAKADQHVVTGRVADAAGRGIAGATVEWGTDDTRFRGRQRVETDANGLYSMTLESFSGRNHLAASAPGYLADYGDRRMGRGRQVRNFVLIRTPDKGHAIAGTVVDEKGKPIKGVRVEAFTPVVGFFSSFSSPTGRDYFAGPDRVVRTDAAGHFRIGELPSGLTSNEVQLSLESKHRYVGDKNYPIGEGVKIVMSGPGKPGVIQGRIVDDATGEPPADIEQIRIVPRYTTETKTHADKDGRFQTSSRATLGENYIVYIYAKGYAAEEARLKALLRGSADYQEIRLKKAPPVVGKLVDADTGKPVAGAAIIYGIADRNRYIEWSSFDKYTDGYHSLEFVQHMTSNDDGEFWFAEPAGPSKGTIIVFADGYQRLMLAPAARQIDKATGKVVVPLQRESAFTGVVFRDGKPASDVSVSVSGPSTGSVDYMYESVRTDKDGKYKYGRLPPGTYHVNFRDCSRVATVGAGETVNLNLGEDLGSMRIHGKASPSITINLHPEFDWEYRGFTTEADAAGEFEISGLKPGKYKASLHYSYVTGYITHDECAVEVEHDGQQIDFLQGTNGKLTVEPEAESDKAK